MKKLLLVLLVVAAFAVVSCGEKTETAADTEEVTGEATTAEMAAADVKCQGSCEGGVCMVDGKEVVCDGSKCVCKCPCGCEFTCECSGEGCTQELACGCKCTCKCVRAEDGTCKCECTYECAPGCATDCKCGKAQGKS